MKEPLIFISVSVEKELPKEQGTYFIILKDGTKDSDIFYPHKKLFEFQESYVKSFLREFPLLELMEEMLIQRSHPENYWKDQTDKEFINDFLTQKGIL